MAAALADARFLRSPCLPFCCDHQSVFDSPVLIVPRSHSEAYLPLGESQLHLSTALSGEPLVVLQASAHDAAGDGEVAVVAAAARFQSSAG